MKLLITLLSATAALSFVPTAAMAQSTGGGTTATPAPSPTPTATTRPRHTAQPVRRPYIQRTFRDTGYVQAYRYDRLDSEFNRDYRVALSTANCAVGFGNETQFARYLEAPNKQFNSFYSLIDNNYSTCISRTGSTDRALYTAAFAESLVVKGDAAYAPRAMTLNVDDADAFIAMDNKSVGALDKVTRCLVVYSPGLAYDVFKTEVGSEAEKAQLDALHAGTPECGNARRPEAIMAGLQRASLAYAFYGWTNRTG